MKRKFFIGSIGKPNEGYVNKNWERCINEKAHVMHQDTIHKGVFDSVKTGSIFFLKYNDNLIAYGEVSTTNNPKDGSSDGWNMRVNVNEWFFYDSKNKKQGVRKHGVQENTLDGDQMATIKEVTSSFGLQKMKEIDNTTKLYKIIGNEFNQDINMEETTLLLTTNHNLILTGAPGTGKTYLAKQIAQQLIFGEVKENLTDGEQKQFDEQCGFVQFHPSYDYADFVEGLRPVQDDNGNVGFERKDGVFKEFCINALNNPNKKFVFIIDEINRGEISKIFGELFFSIDPGYRGEKGKVKTQYQNLVEAGDEFYDGFYVPENVYIIGTMNDIDRSVESMDFAMRRRFAFKEIKAEDRVDMIKENETLSPHFDDIEKRMRNLNNSILSIQGLGSAYQIGASYFLKLENYLVNGQLEESSWNDLWDNHISGLLFEYLRGTPNAAKDLEKLKNAYMKPDDYKYDNDGKVVTKENANE